MEELSLDTNLNLYSVFSPFLCSELFVRFCLGVMSLVKKYLKCTGVMGASGVELSLANGKEDCVWCFGDFPDTISFTLHQPSCEVGIIIFVDNETET